MIRIGVDARCLNSTHVRGMGRYLFELVTHLSELAEVQWHLFAERPDLPWHLPRAKRLEAERFEMRGWRFQRWEQWGLPKRARQANVDLLYSTATTLPWWQPQPTVVTLHDTIPWQQSEGIEQPWYWNRLLPRAYHKCAAIIAPSHSARHDIVARWPRLADKIEVIPHGIGGEWLDAVPAPLDAQLAHVGVRPPYLLYVGGDIPRKRLPWAMQVFHRLNAEGLQLVVCGLDQTAQHRLMQQLPESLRGRLCFPGFVPADYMPNLVQNAVAMLYPTLYEGFGFPVLEAQAVGTPVLFSAVGSLAEVQGPGSIVLPPEGMDAWVSAVRQLVVSRRELATPWAEARSWARQFSWNRSARRHLEVFHRATASRTSELALD